MRVSSNSFFILLPPMKRKASTAVNRPFKKPRTSSTTKQAKRVGAYASRLSVGELKFLDTAPAVQPLTFGNSSFAGSVPPTATNLLNGIAPGSSASQRIGRKLIIKSVYIRWNATLGAASTLGSPLRIIVFYDKQCNAALPATTDVLIADSFIAPNNLSNRDRFVIISDVLTPSLSTQGDNTIAGTIYKKLNLEVMFNAGVAGTVADITSGSLFIMAAQSGTLGTANGGFSYYSRVRYTDV